jgi:hypothetical protein
LLAGKGRGWPDEVYMYLAWRIWVPGVESSHAHVKRLVGVATLWIMLFLKVKLAGRGEGRGGFNCVDITFTFYMMAVVCKDMKLCLHALLYWWK